MNGSRRTEKNRKLDGYLQYFLAARPFSMISSDFGTCSASRHLVSSKALCDEISTFELLSMKHKKTTLKPTFLRLDSQGESYNSTPLDSGGKSLCNKRALSDSFLSCCAMAHDRQLLVSCHYRKPVPIKQCDGRLNISSNVKTLCQSKPYFFQSFWKEMLPENGSNTSKSQFCKLKPQSKVVPCNSPNIVSFQVTSKPAELRSSLQPAESDSKLQYDCRVPLLHSASLVIIPVPCVVDLTSCPTSIQWQHCAHLLPVLTFTSSRLANDVHAVETRCSEHLHRWPRFNCRRKRLRADYHTRCRKRCSITDCVAVDSSNMQNYNISDYESDALENEVIASDSGRTVSGICSSLHHMLAPCTENDFEVWTFPTDIRETQSFASSFFISADELDSSDSCSTDSDQSDFRVYDDDVLAEAEWQCFTSPFVNSVMVGLGDGISSDVDDVDGLYFEDDRDDQSVSCEDSSCTSSVGIEEVNARWNESYSVSPDVNRERNRRQERMVQFVSEVSTVPVLNQQEWLEAYQEARCGPWEQYARDRERFSHRIHQVGEQIDWILCTEHRAAVFQSRRNGFTPQQNSSQDQSYS